ncbi:MAG: 30S ribosomal protein S6 [Acidobacteriota bacterium]
MRTYELMFVTDPRVPDEDVTALTDEMIALLSANGGVTVTKKEFWGRRKLAYEIAKLNEGKYVLVYFASEPGAAQIADVERRLGQNDKVLRFLTIRTDEDLKRAGIPLPLEVETETEPEATEEATETTETAEA